MIVCASTLKILSGDRQHINLKANADSASKIQKLQTGTKLYIG